MSTSKTYCYNTHTEQELEKDTVPQGGPNSSFQVTYTFFSMIIQPLTSPSSESLFVHRAANNNNNNNNNDS